MGGGGLPLYQPRIKSIFGTRTIQHLPLWSAAGPTAADISGNGRDGAYSAAGITYAQPGIGDGKTSVLLAGGYVSINSASFAAAFNPSEFSIIVWGMMSAAGIWTDGLSHTLLALGVDATNYLSLSKASANNTLTALYLAGGVTKSRTIVSISNAGFFSLGMTVSKSNDRLIGYYNGQAMSAAVGGLGVWAGALANARRNIGVRIAPGTEPWSGYAAHAVIISGEATAGEMLAAGAPLA
jgi:hypothetical protein